jgi:hypothetical protein
MGDQNSTYGLHSLPGDVRLVAWATRTRLMGCTHSRGVADWLHGRPELDLWVALTPGGCQVGYIILAVINWLSSTGVLPAKQRGEKCQPYHRGALYREVLLGVALQDAFERQSLKPVFHLIGFRLWV